MSEPQKTVTMTCGFSMKCRICGAEVIVGNTHEMTEQDTNVRLTAYADANTGFLAGVSNGSGDDFQCISCRAIWWAAERERMK